MISKKVENEIFSIKLKKNICSIMKENISCQTKEFKINIYKFLQDI